jgi:hypothetical protein
MTREQEKRRQLEVGGALLLGAVVLAALLAAIVIGLW